MRSPWGMLPTEGVTNLYTRDRIPETGRDTTGVAHRKYDVLAEAGTAGIGVDLWLCG